MDDRGGLLFSCLFLMTLIVIGEGQNSHAHECPTYQSDMECYTVHAETITECARACRPCDAYNPDDFCEDFKRRKRQAYDDSDDYENDDDDDDDDRRRDRCEDLVKRNRTIYSCGCCDGWTYDVNGECKIRLNDTSTPAPVTCRNGGTSMGTYCLCPEDFSGRYCEIAHCDPKCKHSGVCVGRDGQPTCVCSTNYTGVFCETPVCDPPCSNGGTCQSDHYQTYCLCPEGYTGKYCETHAPNPGVCPPPGVGICIHDCSGDSDCKTDEKCCFNGCGHVCMKVEEKPAICVHNNITYQIGDDMKKDPCTKCTCLGQGETHSSDGFVCAVMDCFQNCPYGTFPPGPDECCPNCKDNSTEGVCPPPTGMGTCVQECSEDSECEKGEKCCSNGCGHSCKKVTEKPSICVHNNITYQTGDDIKKDPCTMCTCLGQGQTHSSDGFVCAVMDCFQDCPYGTFPPGPDECCPKCKGVCPPPTGMGTCVEACSDDSDCENSEKCCSNGCGHVCMEVTEKPAICVHNNITYQIGDNMKKDPCTMCTCLGQGQTHSSDGFVCAVMDCFQDCPYGTVPPGPDECCPKCKVKPPAFKVCPVSLQVTVHRERNEVHAGDLFSRSVVAVDGHGMELYVHFSQVMFRHCACDNMNMNIYRVVASATDIHGYDVHCYFTVTVIDVHPPVYRTCPANVEGYNAQYVWWETPGVTDNVAIKNHKLITGKRNGDYFTVGSHLVVYEAEDFEGNKADCRFLVNVYGNHDKSMPESLRRNEEEEEKRRMFIGVGIGVAVLVISLIALTVLCYLRIRTKKQLSSPPSSVGRNGFDNNAYAQYGDALPPSYEKSGVLDKPPVYEELFPNQQDTAIYTDPDEVKLSVDKLKLEFKA